MAMKAMVDEVGEMVTAEIAVVRDRQFTMLWAGFVALIGLVVSHLIQQFR